VLFLHGTPGSRLWCPDSYRPDRTSADCAARVITVDRPGYGRSDPHPGRTLTDWAADVAVLLDALGLDRVPVVGGSAGGPFAMACAIRIPERVTHVGLVSTLGPRQEVDWEDFPPDRKAMLETAAKDPFAALPEMREQCAWLMTPEVVAEPEGWGEADRWLLEDPDLLEVFIAALREAGRQGVDGYAWDRLALDTPWPFAASDVSVETSLWYGDKDVELEPHFNYLAASIPGVRATVWPDEGHAAVMHRDHWGEVLTTVLAR
jgi:pimeloyl-ACP methyl ester carboxylesterase